MKSMLIKIEQKKKGMLEDIRNVELFSLGLIAREDWWVQGKVVLYL